MASFNIANGSTSVDVSLTFNATSANTWSTIGGDTTILGTTSGGWIWSSTDNSVNINAASSASVCQFTGINMVLSLSDPFQKVSIGATGTADVAGSVGWSWTRTSGASSSGAPATTAIDDSMYNDPGSSSGSDYASNGDDSSSGGGSSGSEDETADA
jgi:hypothetical protein